MNKFIITFKNSHAAIKCKRKMKKYQDSIQMVPTPREISSECGFTILVEDLDIEIFVNLMKEKKLSYEIIYKKISENKYEEEKL